MAGAASAGSADPVGNPGEFQFSFPWNFDSCLLWSNGGCLQLAAPNPAADPFILLDLDGFGDVIHTGSSLPYGETRTGVGMAGTVTATLLWINTTGAVDMDVPELLLTATCAL